MNKTVNIVFVVLGVVFVILLLVGAGFYLFTTLSSSIASYSNNAPAAAISSGNTSGTPTREVGGTEFTLTDAQKQALGSFGIDPASEYPHQYLSAEQEVCFVALLGNERVEEIIAGDRPSAMDFFKAKGCI